MRCYRVWGKCGAATCVAATAALLLLVIALPATSAQLDEAQWAANDDDADSPLLYLTPQTVGSERAKRTGLVGGMGGGMGGLSGGGGGVGGPSLSIVNPLDVLRQRVMLEMIRRRMRESEGQIQANREMLNSVGKRSLPSFDFRRHARDTTSRKASDGLSHNPEHSRVVL
ncbi:uncharacterized protein LOC132203141 [Neocloeon triangulifer]|uniref:uncharacterized protein LOC132203141 n=1 Tax=Neocloeon triangulifer TaxID=2078957 RepID=UPI00286F0613|nr:uncharacterized protein LOC132203141 [Neocloeon triangulifer]